MSAPNPAPQPQTAARQAQRGVSLIELMVGIVVALLVGLAASGSAMMFSASQRQGVGTGGVAMNTATVLAAVKNDVTAAGLGFFGDSRFLCDRLNLSVGAAAVLDGAQFAPIEVTRGVTADTLDLVYGSRVESGTNVLLNALSDASSAEVMSYLPAVVGDAVLLAPPTPGDACTVRSVTQNTASTDDAEQLLQFAPAGKHNGAAFGLAPSYAEQGRVTLLGQVLWNRYRVNGGNLVLERPLDGTSAILVRNVISFRIQYGVTAAAAGSTALESWVDPDGIWADISSANIARVRAIRIGVIVQNPQREKADPTSGNCVASETKPTLFGGAEENLDNADWNCFRYRTATVVVPLRNIVMGLR
jgi:type IV pilus assembly protein PilW